MNLHVSAGALIFSVLLACSARPPEPRIAARPVVCTTSYPLQYFATRIAGGLADVRFPAPAGTDPAHWEPDTAIIEAYQNADLILLNGAGYEKWVERASLPPSRLVNTSASFEGDYIPLKGTVTHSHGPEGEHTHGGFAFTTWLDPRLAQKQADSICDALVKLLPERRVIFEQNFQSLASDLAGLDAELARITADWKAPLLASHPVYQYLERRYRLHLTSFHWEPDEMPADSEWRRLERALRTHRTRWMLWEAEPSAEIAARLAKYDVAPVVFDPCASAPAAGDYLTVMRDNIERLRAALAR